jgi:tetratricopeptide (TPR) repeat protein
MHNKTEILKKFSGAARLFLFILIFSQKVFAQSDEIRIANEYYSSGEYEKAAASYEKLSRKEENLLFIYPNYLNTLVQLKNFDAAQKLVKKMIRNYPDDMNYRVDHYLLIAEASGEEKAEKEFQSLLNDVKTSQDKVERTGTAFLNKNKPQKAKEIYLAGRKASGDKLAFATGLSSVYYVLGETEKMIDELLNLLEIHPSMVENIKNIFQNNLRDRAEFELLETNLYNRIQKNPNQIYFNEMLLWIHIQHKNFSKAFLQAKAIDKRNNMQGAKLMEVGKIALENKDYDNAARFYQSVIDDYKSNSPHSNYSLARKLIIQVREEQIKNTYPVDTTKINSLIRDYKTLISELGKNQVTLDAMRNMALLYAFYKNNKDTAIAILSDAIFQAKNDEKFKARAKIDLGDILLLKGEPWESTLLYSQVEKSQKDEPLGHEAKLRNAKLAYYKGEFELAQEHLDVLKLATSREIANDAMDLSILIQDNIGMDTSTEAMAAYAAIDLLLFQNKTDEALIKCDELLKKYPNHSLTDEVYWLKAKLYRRTGNFGASIEMLDKIINGYPFDILGDDAYYLKAIILEEDIKDPEKAKDVYQQLLKKYPGSIFCADARKRFRILRGDKL